MADARRPGSRVVYRCHGCEFEFAVGTSGVTPCPRCGCIGGHERVGVLPSDRGSERTADRGSGDTADRGSGDTADREKTGGRERTGDGGP